MKKKLLLILLMFMFMTNVKALTFNVNLTNIEDEGSGSLGAITNIDVPNKTIDAFFEDIGSEVNFSITIANTGDRAGTLKSINVTSSNDKLEYTTDLPEGGLAINGNDTNKVTITAKVKEGAVNGTSSSEIKITYRYDEGSCPEGEILTEDESMCLCPEGKERNENGICVVPEKKIECADDEIYNEEKKICEKKVIPVPDEDKPDEKTPEKKVVPTNPKTLDNIVLITLLFIVSGLGIYAAMYKKLNTDKQKKVAGAITGTITLTLSFTVLASVFGIDNLLGAIVNPITKTKEIKIIVNETLDLIETWDGDCDVTETLTPDNIFDGGAGTEEDPYQIKTANQFACFAESVNRGTTYDGQYIKQTKTIKLNDHLNERIENDPEGLIAWTPIGDYYSSFNGTYDGGNNKITGLFLHNIDNYYVGLFAHTEHAKFKNMVLSDVYIDIDDNFSGSYVGTLIAYAFEGLELDNIKTYGNGKNTKINTYGLGGVVSRIEASSNEIVKIENVENNMNLTAYNVSGIVNYIDSTNSNTEEDTIILRNVKNNGTMTIYTTEHNNNPYSSGIAYEIRGGNLYLEGLVNTGEFNINLPSDGYAITSGLIVYDYAEKTVMKDSYNTGDFNVNHLSLNASGLISESSDITVDNCFNSGDVNSDEVIKEGVPDDEYLAIANAYGDFGGLFAHSYDYNITNSYNTGTILAAYGTVGGLVANGYGKITNSYNTGDIYGINTIGGLQGYGSGEITNSYNTGNITVWAADPFYEYNITFVGGLYGGSDYAEEISIDNCYNTGNISVLGKIADQNSTIAGISTAAYGTIKNSYNRGNLYSKYSKIYMSGIADGYYSEISNVYNSGSITFENAERTEVEPWWDSIVYSGISDGCIVTNAYNLGDIVINDGYSALGIGGETTNCVNTGNISLIFNVPLTTQRNLEIYGITHSGDINNCFNSGELSIIDNTDNHTTTDPNYNHYIAIGEICNYAYVYGEPLNNKFTNPNGYAIPCPNGSCDIESSESVGKYTTEDVPNILDIINGDGAYNDTLDESGLPTLKVFNN